MKFLLKFRLASILLTPVFLLALATSGCMSIPADVAAPRPVAATDGSDFQVQKGREIYVSFFKCAMCHRPKPVYDYSPDTWQNDILPRMAKKARLSPEEYDAVLAYVTSHASKGQ